MVVRPRLLWFGQFLRWSRDDNNLLSASYRGRTYSLIKLHAAEAVRALTPPGWYFARSPNPELPYPGSYGRLLGSGKIEALMLAEAMILVHPDDQKHGAFVPSLVSCLWGGSSFQSADGRSVRCYMFWSDRAFVLLDLSHRLCAPAEVPPEIASIRPLFEVDRRGPGEGVRVSWLASFDSALPGCVPQKWGSFHAAVISACVMTSGVVRNDRGQVGQHGVGRAGA